MSPKKQPAKDSGKRKNETITIAMKKEIIEKYERGIRVSVLAREYGRASSTISTILKKKEQIKKLDVAKGVTIVTKHRPQIIDDVEKLLLIWLNERQLRGDSVSEAIICAKARTLYKDLLKKTPGTSSQDEDFKASRGWFQKFRRRSRIHSVVRHGEAASSDKAAAEKFVPEFEKFVAREGFLPQQIFNADETGLFWKKLTKKTYITEEEKSLPGHKPMKDRVSLMLCANASGDCKVKPLLVYHSENPRVFKTHKVQKSRLAVMWRSNKKSWVTRVFFTEWVNDVFGPTVKRYLEENRLPLKALLVLDNAPAHPPQIKDDLVTENQFITIKFLPPNTTPLLQPMDQKVISNFKKLYMKALLERCIDVLDTTNLTLKEFWKEQFHIVAALRLIDKAWLGVTRRTLISAWRNLWPEGVPERDFEGFDAAPVDDPDAHLVHDIVALGQSLGLEVDADDVEEYVEEHSEDLTTEELEDLQKQLDQEEAHQRSSGEEEEVREVDAPTTVIREVLGNLEKAYEFAEMYHPDKAKTVRCVNLFSDLMSHFKDIVNRRQKQPSIEKFFEKAKKRALTDETSESEPQPGPSGLQFPRRESPPGSPSTP